jgi:hypothetical protein
VLRLFNARFMAAIYSRRIIHRTSMTSRVVTAADLEAVQWWIWSLALFLVCFVLGMLAVPAGGRRRAVRADRERLLPLSSRLRAGRWIDGRSFHEGNASSCIAISHGLSAHK